MKRNEWYNQSPLYVLGVCVLAAIRVEDNSTSFTKLRRISIFGFEKCFTRFLAGWCVSFWFITMRRIRGDRINGTNVLHANDDGDFLGLKDYHLHINLSIYRFQ